MTVGVPNRSARGTGVLFQRSRIAAASALIGLSAAAQAASPEDPPNRLASVGTPVTSAKAARSRIVFPGDWAGIADKPSPAAGRSKRSAKGAAPKSSASRSHSRDALARTTARSGAHPTTSPAFPADTETRAYLETMVRRALALSPDVNAAKANWQAAEYDVDQAKGERWPQVQLGGASPSVTFGSGTNDSARNAIGSVSVVTPLYDWGRIGRTIDSRAQTSNANYQLYLQAQQKVAFDTVAMLIELRRNLVILDQSDAYVKRMDELVAMLSEIVKSDAGRGSELTQARARRLQALTARDLVQARIGEIQVALAKLVGAPVEFPPDFRWDVPLVGLDQALSTFADHPSVLQARAEAKAASLYAQSVHDSRWPQLNWVVSKTTQQDTYGNAQPWSTGVSVQWNAFSGGSLSAQERAARARADAGEERANATSRDLEYTLRTAAEQRDMALGRAAQYDDLIRESDKVRKMFYEQWYHLGRRTLLDVLIAESEHYGNQVAQANSRYDGEAANVRLYADSGVLLQWLAAQPGAAR